MEIVYFGKKRPKKVVLTIDGVTYEKNFIPFRAVEVEDKFGRVLLDNAGDIFKRVDQDERAPDPKPQPKTDGYVGDKGADQLKDVNKQIQKDMEIEKGKDIKDLGSEKEIEVDQLVEEELSAERSKKAKKIVGRQSTTVYDKRFGKS